MTDSVNHPEHYTNHPSGVECIEIAQHMNFCRGNALKYLWRAGLKDKATEIQDLEKAIWCLQCEIKRLKANQAKTANLNDWLQANIQTNQLKQE